MTLLRLASLLGLVSLLARDGIWYERMPAVAKEPKPLSVGLSWMLNNPLGRGHADRLVRRIAVEPGSKILDMGCGPGRMTLPVARATGPQGEVVAVDLQQGMLDKLTKRAAAVGQSNNLRTVRASAGEAPLPESYFDLALLMYVLGEIPSGERVTALKNISQSLRPTGRLVVLEGRGDPHRLNPNTVQHLAEQAGLRPHGRVEGRWNQLTTFVPALN